MKTGIKSFFTKVTKSENIFCLLTVIFLVWLLLVNPIAGIADNGDFNRALMPNYMTVPDDVVYFDLVTEEYTIINPLPIIYPSYVNAHILPVMTAKMLNVLTYSREVFNIRFMSAVYIMLFAVAMCLILRGFKLKKLWQNVLLFSLFVFMFANSGNALYFGSLYAEPAAFVFFLAAAGCLRLCVKSDKPCFGMYIAFLVFAALFFGSKMQYAPLAVLLIPLSVYAVRIFRERKTAIITVTVVGCVACLMFYICQPSYLDNVTTYNAVFRGIVTDEESAEYLDELGLPKEYAALAGTGAFDDEHPIDIYSDEFNENFYEKMSKGKLVKFYLTHPLFFINTLEENAKSCYLNQPKYLGNRTASYSAEKVTFDGLQHYCDFKLKFFPKNFWCIAAFLALYAAWLVFRFKRGSKGERLWTVFLMMLIVFATVQYVLPTVGDGGADLAKQLYMFNISLDFLLFCMICSFAEFLTEKWEDREC